jgi:predicted peptidase
MEIQFKDLYIQALPEPVADESKSPGFHLRTVSTSSGERKYTLFVPKGYDGEKPVPAVLFLHGAGERGEDGVRSAQVGLGAAIAQNPDAFPALAIFPQARQTWAADSEDAAAALAALDDVCRQFRVDPDRIALTGLSMGGHGAWEQAAKAPERFSAVLPICGSGRVDSVGRIKDLPVWTVVGDADRASTVLGLRELVAALKEAGAPPRATEYRGVGHNSWDRAYNDPEVITWLLTRKRGAKP